MTYISVPYPPSAVAKGIISLQDNMARLATFQSQMETLSTALRVSCSISMVANLAILASFVFVKRLRTQINNLVCYLTIADVFVCIFGFLGDWPLKVFKSDTFCFIQGFLIQYFVCATALWTAMIATHCLLAVKLRKPMAVAAAENYKWYHLAVWGISLVVALIPFAVQDYNAKGAIYADAGIWCWIGTKYNNYQVSLLYGPMWAVFVYTIFAYTYVGIKIVQARKFVMKSGSGKASQSSINRFAFKAFLYCIVFLFSWVPGTFNRASAIIDDNPMHTVYEFFLVQTIVMPLHGFMNSLIFFFFALTGNMPETSNSGSKNGYSSRDNSRSRSRSRKDEEYQNYN